MGKRATQVERYGTGRRRWPSQDNLKQLVPELVREGSGCAGLIKKTRRYFRIPIEVDDKYDMDTVVEVSQMA